jgi:uncharacterized YkwD family protein
MKKLSLLLIFALCFACQFAGAAERYEATAIKSYPYKVQRGDAMSKLAGKFNVSLGALLAANPTVHPNRIYPGQILNIPRDSRSVIVSKFSVEVAKLVNRERAKRGLPALKLDGKLTQLAQAKAEDMRKRKYFSHTSPAYGSAFQMMDKFGVRYSCAGENIAKGQESPLEVVTDWMKSPGHKRNILNPDFDTIGVGHSQEIWVQMFIQAKS